ncbi:odorant receptor 4-like isoform X2 [Aethina tumida]|uniref:odorant receptor 4-like isoform X2 n=1 Tax=Aethina tumida TaxID=116153 RepID=UPI002149755D|nr:odorant receptor 4-like isoform X2 [Aethina tumida]
MHGYHANFFETIVLTLKLFGIWVPNNLSNFKEKLYHFYMCTFLGIAWLYFISEIIIIKDTHKSLFDLISNIGLLITHVVGVIKFSTLFFRRKKIEEMMQILQSNRFKYESVGDFKPSDMFNESKEISSKHTWCLFVVYGLVGISAHFSGLINMGGISSDEVINCSDYVAYYSYFPFNMDSIGKCHILFFLMDVPLIIFALYIAAFDSLFGTLANCLKCQLLIVCKAFTSIRERVLTKLNLPQDFQIFRDEQHPMLEQALFEEMKRCTVHLSYLIRVHTGIEEIFTYVILTQSIVSLIVFATCLYVGSSVPLMSPEFFSHMEYFVAVFMQFTTYCWYGSEIIFAGHSVGPSIFNSDWTSTSERFKKAMILNIIRMRNGLHFSIGKFTPLTVATLITVLRGSFSYFAVFKSME